MLDFVGTLDRLSFSATGFMGETLSFLGDRFDIRCKAGVPFSFDCEIAPETGTDTVDILGWDIAVRAWSQPSDEAPLLAFAVSKAAGGQFVASIDHSQAALLKAFDRLEPVNRYFWSCVAQVGANVLPIWFGEILVYP